MLQMENPVFQFVPIASCAITGHHQKQLGPIHWAPALSIFISIDKIPSLSPLLCAKQPEASLPFFIREMLQPLLIFVAL